MSALVSRARIVAFLLALGALGCATGGRDSCRPGETPAVSDLLYFGTARPGGVVSHDEWLAFVAKEITPRFPAGITSWQASGQWQSANGTLQIEQSRVLSIVHPSTDQDDRAIRVIIDRYRDAFQQEAVLRTRTTTCMSLE